MTKRFEEVVRAPLSNLRETLAQRDLKGECVIVVGPPTAEQADLRDVESALIDALSRGSVRDAATEIAEVFGLPRKDVYAMALGRGTAQKKGEGD
jgi:16S rRNA (cytidine1402-2'-O)-methyltransferase